MELLGADGLRYDDWTMRRPETSSFYGRDAGYRYLRAKGNSIEGGTSEILRNIIAERVLGLPAEPRADTGRALEGPAPVSRDHTGPAGATARIGPDLLYGEAENDLRAAVRDLLDDRGAVAVRPGQDRDPRSRTTPLCGARWPPSSAARGLLIPERHGGAGASYREAAVVAEETGRSVAPVPYLGSAVVATTALLASDDELLEPLADRPGDRGAGGRVRPDAARERARRGAAGPGSGSAPPRPG